MKNKVKILLMVLFICFIVFEIRAEIIEKTVAIVNDEIITLSELEYTITPIVMDNKTKFEGEEGKKRLKDLRKDILNRMIEVKLTAQEAKARNIEATKGEIENALRDAKNRFPSDIDFEIALKNQGMTIERLKEKIKEQLISNRLIAQEVNSKIIIEDKEIEEFYRKHLDEFKELDKIRVSHILAKPIPDEESARKKLREVMEKLKTGTSFSELARQYSEDESTKDHGGNLGIMKKGDMTPELETAAFSLKEEQYSDIIKTAMGFHIIKLEAKIPGRYYSLIDEVDAKKYGFSREKISIKELIKYELIDGKTKSKYDSFINELREKSKSAIEIHL